YAAGDVTPGLQLVQVAAAKGTIAGVACAQSLRGTPGAMTDTATPDNDPTPTADRIHDLEREIDEIRQRVDDPLDQGDQMYIDDSETDPDVVVDDDAIVPPG
ncbi:MAG: hypothetical protein ABIW46_06025, partial [Acidimicrobiales bacterium]